ncbi:MAG TPA: hypothetical protein VLV31_12320 [Candidatus Acidoferrales bacterium]|nr:hypothetical protein [Candidatus Acidoferrales bacterium]
MQERRVSDHSASYLRLSIDRSRGNRCRFSSLESLGCEVGGFSVKLGSSSVIADVGSSTLTIGFHFIPFKVGTVPPHSKHWLTPSGFGVPQEEQYTGLRIAPQAMQYLPSVVFGFLQDGQMRKASGNPLLTTMQFT